MWKLDACCGLFQFWVFYRVTLWRQSSVEPKGEVIHPADERVQAEFCSHALVDI